MQAATEAIASARGLYGASGTLDAQMMTRPFENARRGPRSADYTKDQKRRRRFVRSWLRDHGMRVSGNVWRCECEVCHRLLELPLADWTADHIHPVALGGDEFGPLRLACRACQTRQASKVANLKNPRAIPRKRPDERHPGRLDDER